MKQCSKLELSFKLVEDARTLACFVTKVGVEQENLQVFLSRLPENAISLFNDLHFSI